MDTCDLVDEDTGRDDASVLGEKLLQLLLGHGLGQAANIQVGITDGGRAGSRIRHLEKTRNRDFKLVQHRPSF